MCDYCEKFNNNNVECVTMTSSINDLGILGDMQVGIVVWKNEDGSFEMDTCTSGVFDRVEEAVVKISYCPICGRKLSEVE